MAGEVMGVLKDGANRLQFDLALDDKEALQLCAFIVLVSLRHGGTVIYPTNAINGAGERRGVVMVQFKDFADCSDARAHCSGQLESDGRVRRSYLGALETVDPGFRKASALQRQLRRKPK